MAEYISKEYIIDKCKEHRELYISAWGDFSTMLKDDKAACDAYATCWSDVVNAPAADVQPISVVAEHIKKRLYQTAFNTTEEKARDTIVDMAKRIDIWVDELKVGDVE
jgi:hypothetical protein